MAHNEQRITRLVNCLNPLRCPNRLGHLTLQQSPHCGQNFPCPSPWTFRKKIEGISSVEDWNKNWVLLILFYVETKGVGEKLLFLCIGVHCLIWRTTWGQAWKMVSTLVLVIISHELVWQLCVKVSPVDFKLSIWGHQALTLSEGKLSCVCRPHCVMADRWACATSVWGMSELVRSHPLTSQRGSRSLPVSLAPLPKCHYCQEVLVWLGFLWFVSEGAWVLELFHWKCSLWRKRVLP